MASLEFSLGAPRSSVASEAGLEPGAPRGRALAQDLRNGHLDPKGRGDKSMLVKRGTAEDVYAVVLQRLSDKAKTGLFESCATSPIAGFSSQRREVRKSRPPGHPTYRMAKALGD